ncbi:MAG: S41 family peptidase [Trueperaceae bacterium]|nr:S41 family peptidase [Trueperaceae bacterium]
MNRRIMILVAGLVLVSTWGWAQFGNDRSEEFMDDPTGQALVQVYGALRSNYLDEVDSETILRGAIEGMIGALDDPFSYYLEPRSAERQAQDRTGSFEGIGAVLTPLNRQTGRGVEVLQVYQGGPAATAGLQRGDIFLEVDGTDVRKATISDVVDLVRGPRGTEVDLRMRRPGRDQPVDFAIQRDRIDIIDVASTMLQGDVGYIDIRQFGNERVHDQLVSQLEELRQAGATSLVLDLRDNPGGLLTQGIMVADEFLSEGDIVFQRARGVTQRIARADPHANEIPMVVLVNENSASASEIVAGALQENDRALVVGEETYGKGVAQSVISLADGGQLAFTSFEWLTPARETIAHEGIEPDVHAEDERYPNTISLEGQGAEAGQTVEIVVDGESLGSATADEDGEFQFVTTGPRPEISPVQGEAMVDLDADPALRTAVDTLLNRVVAGGAAD